MSAAVSGLRRVLLLGAGYTAAPLVEWLTKDGTTAITIASRTLNKALKLAGSYQNTNAVELDVTSENNLSAMIPGHNIVVSSLPCELHPTVAKQCINHKVHMINTSYVTPEIQKLDGPAKEAGVCLFTEMGLDPGIDHMLAMEFIDEVHDKGGKILSYGMSTGGLPLPHIANNPLKYKFSWAPKSVFDTCLESTTFLKDGKLIHIPEGGGSMLSTMDVNMIPGHMLESFPSGDSTLYRDVYNIPEVQTLIRGHLRYKGYCSIINGMNKLGLFSGVDHPRLQPDAARLQWRELMKILLDKNGKLPYDLRTSVLHELGGNIKLLEAIEGLGLLSDAVVPLKCTPMESLSTYLDLRLQYQPEERDTVFMRLNFTIQWPDNKKEDCWIDMVEYGTPGSHFAMAKYVGLPAAIGASMMMDGTLKESGVIRPTMPVIYKPVLKTLREDGLRVKICTSK